MIKHTLILIALILSNTLAAQKYSGNVFPFKSETFDVVVFPFGLEYPLKIGSIDKDGLAQINLNSIDLSHIPMDVKSMFLSRVTDNFFPACDDPESLGISTKIKSIKCGSPFLWSNKEQAGVLFLASDEKLVPWLEDRYFNEPETASFFEILYIDQDVNIENKCTTTYNLGSGNVEADNHFKLSLKKGFNVVQYKIESIHKTNPEETSSIPVKTQVLIPSDEANIKWIVKYF